MTTAFFALSGGVVAMGWSGGASAQWPEFPDPSVPRDADGDVITDAPPPRTSAGTPDLGAGTAGPALRAQGEG